MFVVTVNFSVKRDQIDQFKPLMLENARLSLELEPGCKQFDVCFDPREPWECFLYEVYDDKPAFETHLQMPHFKLFDTKVTEILDNKIVKTLT